MRKKGKRIISLCLVLVMAAGYITGAKPELAEAKKTSAKKTNAVKSIRVTNVAKKKISMKTGEKFTLKTKVTLKKGKKASRKVKYASSKKAVATVNSRGVIKAKKAGKAKITVTSKASPKKKVVIKVTVVKNIPVKKITLSKSSLTLCTEEDYSIAYDSEYELKATVFPANATKKKLVWTSSNPKVVTVESDGMVSAESEGTAVITAKATDGSGVKAVCKVTVIDNSLEDDEDGYDEDDDDSYDEGDDEEDGDDDYDDYGDEE